MQTGIDLSQFYRVFFEEAAENLESLEELLTGLDHGHADQDRLRALFRHAKSIKAGADTFGFHDLLAPALEMKTMLDNFLRKVRVPDASNVAALHERAAELKAALILHQTEFALESPQPVADLSKFKEVYFDEADESLDSIHLSLREVNPGALDASWVDTALARLSLAESGANTLGLTDLAALARETGELLSGLRSSEPASAMQTVNVLIIACSALKLQLARCRREETKDGNVQTLLDAIFRLVKLQSEGNAPAAGSPSPGQQFHAPRQKAAPVVELHTGATRKLMLTVGPMADVELAEGIFELFHDFPELGTIEATDRDKWSAFLRRFRVVTSSPNSELLALFEFYVPGKFMQLELEGPSPVLSVDANAAVPASETCPVCQSAVMAHGECQNGHAPISILASQRSYMTTSTQIARLLSSRGFRVTLADGGLYSIAMPST